MSEEPTIYRYDPEPDAFFEEGVTTGWLVAWSGRRGPAQSLKIAALADAEGVAVLVPDGEWQTVEVVDDASGPPRT